MFRLATPADYEYLPDIGLYELTFDKRPVQGVRCENPEQGAQQYNASQQRVKTVRLKERRHRENFTPLKELSWNGVLDWCLARGTQEECRLVLAYYKSACREERKTLLHELFRHSGIKRESNALVMIALFSITGHHLASVDKIRLLEEKAAEVS